MPWTAFKVYGFAECVNDLLTYAKTEAGTLMLMGVLGIDLGERQANLVPMLGGGCGGPCLNPIFGHSRLSARRKG